MLDETLRRRRWSLAATVGKALRAACVVVAAFLAVQPAFGGQVEVAKLPSTVDIRADGAQRLEVGLHALDTLNAPSIEGSVLVNRMPHEATVLVGTDGTAVFSYHDLFLRHYHDRRQTLISGEGLRLENLNDLPDGAVLPKILLDAFALDAPDLFLDGDVDQLYWSGSLVWKLDFGLPMKALSLASPNGLWSTRIGDEGWEERGQGVVVSLSADGASWLEVWRSKGEGGEKTVTASLPPALVGKKTLYLRFEGLENVLFDLYLTVELDAASLPALQVPSGSSTLHLGGDGAALLFWTNPGVRLDGAPPAPPAAPQVQVEADRVRVAFPGGGRLDLCRSAAGGVVGPCRLDQGEERLLEPPLGGFEGASLVFVDGDPIPGYDDWKAEVDALVANGAWRSTGSRTLRAVSLSGSELVDAEVLSDGTVAVRTRLSDGGTTGTVTWEVRPASRQVAGRPFAGVSWQVRVEGLEAASQLVLTEPVVLPVGRWWIEQSFRDFTDDVLDLATPYNLAPGAKLGGSSQSFRFMSGPDGTAVGLFEAPVWAPFSVREERGRRLIRVDLPLGVGRDRRTPWRTWLSGPAVAGDAWAARDLWAEVRDEITGRMAREQGIPLSRPRPTLVWNQPSEAYYEHWIAHHEPLDGEYWLDWARDKLLPRAAGWGLDVLYIQPPWDSDSEHVAGGSGNAPRDLVISPAIGGEAAMAAFVQRAHQLGLHIVLWYPSTFSLRATIFEQHPGWVAFTAGGTPLNAGWLDVAAASLRSGYFPYLLARLGAIQDRLHLDGYWLDSWTDLTLLTDYRPAQPMPQLPWAEEVLRTMWRHGVRVVTTEGMGPLANADAYGDYEVWVGGIKTDPRVLGELERIRGREHMLYRIGANVIPDSQVYFRSLAAGGVVNIATMDNLDDLDPGDQDRIKAANRAFHAVDGMLVRRHLVVRDGRWVGVAWDDGSGAVRVLWSFAPFSYSVPAGSRVTEVSGETPTAVDPGASLDTGAWKVYRISPPPSAPRRPSAAARPGG